MHLEKNTIIFTLYYEGKTYQIQTREKQYGSLMCLLSENFNLKCFGVCYGGGCCGTCGVVISENAIGSGRFILSCEVQIDDEIANKVIRIL
jgi:hypothetical protein